MTDLSDHDRPIVAEPFDRVVFERTSTRDGLVYAAPSQLAADLLTSPGRGPAEAEALLLARHLFAGVTAEALEHRDRPFRRPRGVGCQMVVRAAGGSGNLLVDAETVAASCAILATDLLASTRS
jgi:hypothetical protein